MKIAVSERMTAAIAAVREAAIKVGVESHLSTEFGRCYRALELQALEDAEEALRTQIDKELREEDP
jgi:hypothetical protein